MKNININFQKQTIEMTKTFANSASNYGSEAYNELMNAKRDFPSYTVTIVKTASKKKDSFKGLNLQYMKKYITEKSGAESEQMATFNLLCGNTDDELAARASFGEIKMWFLDTYPEIKNFHESRADRIKAIKEKQKKAAEEKAKAKKVA